MDDYRNRNMNMKHKQLKALVIGTTSWDTIIDIEDFPKKAGTCFASARRDVLGGRELVFIRTMVNLDRILTSLPMKKALKRRILSC